MQVSCTLLLGWRHKVKDSQCSGMSQSCFFCLRLGTQSQWVFSLSWLFDEGRLELLRDTLRSPRVLSATISILIYSRNKIFFISPSSETHEARKQRLICLCHLKKTFTVKLQIWTIHWNKTMWTFSNFKTNLLTGKVYR